MPEGRKKRQVLKRKYLKLDVRGKQLPKEPEELDQQLMDTIDQWAKEETRVPRTMIFRKALEINPDLFSGQDDNINLMKRMNKWFHYTFVK